MGYYLNEVHEDVSEALHVVPPALLDPKVRVDRRVPSRTRQVLVFSKINFNFKRFKILVRFLFSL